MQTLIVYHMDGSRQVIKPRQEAEKFKVVNNKLVVDDYQKRNFCGNWKALAEAVSGGRYLKFEVI